MASMMKPLACRQLGVMISALLGVLAVLAAWQALYSQPDPAQLFRKTFLQSLATSGVTIQSDQKAQNAEARQTVQYSFGAFNISRTLTTLQQNNTTITDELIGTPTTNYTRYVGIQTNQRGANGKPLNFSSILNVWATSAVPGPNKISNTSPLFSQAVLGVGLPVGGTALPIANLPPAARNKLVRLALTGGAYTVDYKKVKIQKRAGRLQYVYPVSVAPEAYATFMKEAAKAMGLRDLNGLDPASFHGQSALQMALTVDVRSAHLVAAQLGGAASSYRQSYGSYDVPVMASLPTHTISMNELQQRLANLR